MGFPVPPLCNEQKLRISVGIPISTNQERELHIDRIVTCSCSEVRGRKGTASTQKVQKVSQEVSQNTKSLTVSLSDCWIYITRICPLTKLNRPTIRLYESSIHCLHLEYSCSNPQVTPVVKQLCGGFPVDTLTWFTCESLTSGDRLQHPSNLLPLPQRHFTTYFVPGVYAGESRTPTLSWRRYWFLWLWEALSFGCLAKQ